MDIQIKKTQEWLNSTYNSTSGWVPVPEHGMTGWDTIYGLCRALQKELGISPVVANFGAATRAAYINNIGRIDKNTTNENILRILSGSLWCKGYPGVYDGDSVSFQAISASIGTIRSDLGLDNSDPYVDVKLMYSLLSMDSYRLHFLGSGTPQIREAQAWLNFSYSHRLNFDLIPCDGLFSRQVQTALFFALQYEFGMSDEVANGNFGPGTMAGLKSNATVGIGSTDSSHNYVRLFQAALRFNRYDAPFTGNFDFNTSSIAREFQDFMELQLTGNGNYSTWCSLLTSSGDNTISTKGFDTSTQLTLPQALGARAQGYTHVGRYTVGAGKFLTSGELDAIRQSGLKLFPIHQRYNDSANSMTYEAGTTQGLEALERGRVLGLPKDSLIFFSVDFDPVGEIIYGSVLTFFQGINDIMKLGIRRKFRVGIYGTRNVCQVIMTEGKSAGAFVAGMSTGFSGNMGFPMPEKWQYNQILELSEGLGGITTRIDHVVVSSNAEAVDLSQVISPPIERNSPSNTATGFDIAFEWVCKAEVACELALSRDSSILLPLDTYSALIYDAALDAIRTHSYDSLFWNTYLPRVYTDNISRTAYETILTAMGTIKPILPDCDRDFVHWAATTLGYRIWGAHREFNGYGLGDLSGWPLDLLQAWGVFTRELPQGDLKIWMEKSIGKLEGNGFGYGDVLADADSWLTAKAKEDNPELGLSDVMRTLFSLTDNQRIGKFYAERFDGRSSNVVAAFLKLVDGLDFGGINVGFTQQQLLQAARADYMPTAAQATICAEAYASALVSLGE